MPLIDLSATLEDDRRWAPWWARNRVTYQGHAFGRRAIRLLFGLPGRLLRTRLGWANENISLSTHGTTHVDAPWHYGPTCDGRPARTIDELPLEWFFGDGVMLDMTHKPADAAIDAGDLAAGLEAIGHTLSPGTIVLIRTGNDRLIGRREYFDAGPGVTAAATRWLIDAGVRLAGIDSWGWDCPLKAQAKLARRSGRDDLFWAAHFAATDAEFCHMERLVNLDKLPPCGFRVAAFPLKVKRGSAGPARVVAIVEPKSAEQGPI